MDKNIKYIIITALIAGMLGYILFFKTEVTVDSRSDYVGEIVRSDISLEEDYISIRSFFGDVSSLSWIDDNNFIMYGVHESEGESYYKFNISDLNLERINGNRSQVKLNDQEYTVIKSLGTDKLLLSNNKGNRLELSLYSKNKIYSIGYAYKSDEIFPVKISSDLNKVIYLDEDLKINTYRVSDGKHKKDIVAFTENEVVDFNNKVEFSNDGGYFIYKKLDKMLNKCTFSVYGADSGRLYAEEIVGVSPKWSSNGAKIAFFYSGDTTGEMLTTSRLGVLDLKTRKINYLDRVKDDEYYNDNIYWMDDNETVVFTTHIADQTSINLLNINKLIKMNYNIKLENVTENITVLGNSVYWLSREDGGKVDMSILTTSGKSPQVVSDIKPIDKHGEVYYLKFGSDIAVFQGNYLIRAVESGMEDMMYLGEDSYVLGASEDGSKVIVQRNSTDSDKIELKIYNIK